MSHIMRLSDPNLRVAAAIAGVREVTLVGTADLAFWRAQLQPIGLRPYADAGQALVTISATAARWQGLAFCELSFSIAVGSQADERAHAGYFLARAYNSRRALAFAERTFFKTPYYAGKLQVLTGPSARIELIEAGVPAFRAAMAGDRPAQSSGDDTWEGPIYLPGAAGSRFYARLAGDSQVYAFAPGQDTLSMRPAAHAAIFGQLLESGFAPREWRVRSNATHIKSQTYALASIRKAGAHQ